VRNTLAGLAAAPVWPRLAAATAFGAASILTSGLVATFGTRLLPPDPSSATRHQVEDVASAPTEHTPRPEEHAALAPEEPAARGAPARDSSELLALALNVPPTATDTVLQAPAAKEPKAETQGADLQFVAVLATRDDPAVAEEAFFRVRERYGAILGTAEPQVEMVETQDGGTWYRASALPPVSRTDAKDLCRRLREAGHWACWVKAQARSSEAEFVAVLATHNDLEAAQETFRRLRERYAGLLGQAQPLIETVKGAGATTWHRLSVLPAVSRSEAKDLCRQLRQAGHAGCWVKPHG
jgi:hypothetical protein